MNKMQEFLVERKRWLLDLEKRAKGRAQDAILGQLQAIDSLLVFYASQQTEEDMAKLRLTLERQATPVDDIRPRQDNAELTEGLIELATELGDAFEEEQKKAKKEGRQPKDVKYTLNNLPDDIKPKSVSSKIYGLRAAGKLPPNVLPAMRTVKDEETGKPKQELYMKWVKNPPKVSVDERGE